ncbi:MAG: gamma carbonic anhydrase family protein [Saprospiraceae bacterium]|jgi:carbonic anhydrase/acetyltransferase-like protein (isoleucine patch superfamily)|nr:gamma carbonic anhydrase family protein [Saprospiraceae bacterium]MBK9992916.1 gamma carbonic anhydrase family protein [Saprospiraceae bacterium]
MASIIDVRGFHPKIGNDCFLAENATIIGDVVIGDRSSVWFQAVVRGDVHEIRIGNEVNIQDGAIIHCTYEKAGTYIGDRVSIGHRAIVHGCKVHSDVLIGMGAIVMDNAVVESNVLIAAGAVVLENSHLESGHIYGGIPAKKIKVLDPDTFQFFIDRTAKNYQLYSSWFTK